MAGTKNLPLRHLVLLGLLLAGPAQAATDVVVPGFVDPGHQTEKPDISGLRVIRFVTTDDYPPFNFTAADGSPAGYNVDLVRAICDELRVPCSIQVRGWEALLPALQGNAADAVAASLAISARTRAEVELSGPTMKTPARFAARLGTTPGTLPDTIGRAVVGVQSGTAHEAYLRAYFPAATLKLYPDPDSLRTALKTGAVDLVFADGIATALWLNGTAAARCCGFVGGPFTEDRFFGAGSGIAVRKGDLTLKHAFDFALERLSAKGTLADLYLKYFPVGFY